MKITVNGDTQTLQEGTTIADLLNSLDADRRFVAVERNKELVPRKEHSDCILQSGDAVEIVTLVGGG